MSTATFLYDHYPAPPSAGRNETCLYGYCEEQPFPYYQSAFMAMSDKKQEEDKKEKKDREDDPTEEYDREYPENGDNFSAGRPDTSTLPNNPAENEEKAREHEEEKNKEDDEDDAGE